MQMLQGEYNKKVSKRIANKSLSQAFSNNNINANTYSNLIFNQHKRGISALTDLATRPSNKQRRDKSVILVKSSRQRKLSSSEYHADNRHSVQITSGPSRVNVINLMSGSLHPSQKPKSSYCKKITLSNVDKYYDYCVKKVRSILCCSVDINKLNLEQAQFRKARNHYESQSTELPRSESKQLKRVQSSEVNSSGAKYEIQFMNQDNSKGCLINYVKSAGANKQPNDKIPYSSFCRFRPRASRANNGPSKMHSRKNVEQFKLDAWESADPVNINWSQLISNKF